MSLTVDDQFCQLSLRVSAHNFNDVIHEPYFAFSNVRQETSENFDLENLTTN